MAEAKRIAVIGAGLSGLTAAWRLQRAGHAVSVFERTMAVGGRTATIRKDGYVFDVGAITMLPTYAGVCALVRELDIGAHLHRIVPVIGIPRAGRTHRLDLAHPLKSLLGTSLISVGTKLRMLKLLRPMIRTWNLSTYESLSTLAAFDSESIADFSRRTCGSEFLEYVADPIIRGNTLNSVECAPAGELLWMLRQYAAPYVLAFDQGINYLAETLGARLSIQRGAEVISVRTVAGQVELQIRSETQQPAAFDACVIAVPPKQLLSLAPRLTQRQRNFLESVEPLVSVNLHVGLTRAPAATETFILPPRTEHTNLTTIVMDHLKAPGRAPEGKGVVSFFLSDDWSKKNFERADEEILETVLAMAVPFIGDVAPQVESFVVQRWPYAIIKSRLGLYSEMQSYEQDLDLTDRVQFAGDFLSMGMEAAVSSGSRVAARVERILQGTVSPASFGARAVAA